MNFEAGQFFSYKGVDYRIINGKNGKGDLVIEFRVNGGAWHRPHIAHTMILTSFKFQVEQNNYGENGSVKKGRGGWYLLDKLKRACIHGWKQEAECIEKQRMDLESARTAAQAQLGLPI